VDLLSINDAPDTKQFWMAWWIVGGWAPHYVPFYFIVRVLFLHHYLLALYFSLFVPPYVMEFVLLRLGLCHYRNAVMVAVAASVVSVFWMFADLSYSMRGTNAESEYLQWLNRGS
jgi:dolichyl-phosphate-mannose-protein mannosyltransferase